MYQAIFPIESSPSDQIVFADDIKRLPEILGAGTPVVMSTGTFRNNYGYSKIPSPSIVLQLSKPYVSKTMVQVGFKWNFTDRTPKARNWTGNILINLARPDGLRPPQTKRCNTSMSFARASDAQITSDLELLLRTVDGALRTYIERGGIDTRTIEGLEQYHAPLRAAIRSSILEENAKNQEKVAEAAAQDASSAALINEIPNGTPLVYRQGIHGGTWQLGVKRGKITTQRAMNTAIATPEVLRGDELKAAGFSNHQILMHEARALKALADHPEAAFFQKGHPTLQAMVKLHDTRPFHDSFHDPERLKAARKGPKIWMQTCWATSGSQRFCRGLYSGSRAFETPTPWGPSFPHHPQARSSHVSRITNVYHRRPSFIAPEEFAFVADLWCVSARIANLLNEHDIGGTTFRPLRVYEKDNKTRVPGEWYHMIMGAPSQLVRMDPASAILTNCQFVRTVQPFEVEVDGDAAKHIDLWWDDRLPRQLLFMSGRLKSALTKAGVRLGLGLKPCMTL